MDTADFRIYTGVDNQVEFLLRRQDRKPVNVVGRQVRLVMKNRYTNEILAQPYLTVIDPNKGHMLLTLSKELTENWPVGALSYGAIVEEPDGSELLLFTDEQERGKAFCYVTSSPITVVPPSDSILIYNFPVLRANISHTRRIRLEQNGEPFDTTGWQFVMQIRTSQSENAAIFATLDQSSGLEVVFQDDEVFLEIRFGPFNQVVNRIDTFYDIVATKNADSTIWLKGRIPFEPGVTYS
jgi:hypothetical protein